MEEAFAFLCLVAGVTDADTLRCADGTRIRIAAIDARERNGTCNQQPCAEMPHAQAQPIVARMTMGKRLQCFEVGRSYNRVVAHCYLPDQRGLSCAIVKSGAAVRLDRYWRQYKMPGC